MKSIDTASSGSSIGLQVAFVIVASLVLARLVFIMPSLVLGAVILGAIFFVSFLQRPDLGLLVVLLVRASTDVVQRLLPDPAIGTNTPEGALFTLNLGLLIVLVVGGGTVVLMRRLPFMRLPGGVLLVLLLVTGLVGIFRSESLVLSVDQWTPVAGVLIVYALAASLFPSPRQVRRVIDVLAASFVLPAAFGLYQMVVGEGLVLEDIGVPRVRGTFVHANPFGLYLVVILSVFINQVLIQRGKRKLVAIVIVALAGVLLVASFARFAWVGAVIVLLTVGILRSRKLLLVLPLALILTVAFVPITAQRFSDPLGGSFADRVEIWKALIARAESANQREGGPISAIVNRVGGLGPGASLMLGFRLRGTHPHNDYVRVFIEYGVFGLVLYVVLFGVLIVTAYRSWRQSSDDLMRATALSFLALAVAYPVMSITAQLLGLMANQVYFWTLAGLTVAAGRFSSQGPGPSFPPNER